MRFGREPVSGYSHLFGAMLGIMGAMWLIALTRHDIAKMVSMLVYGGSLIVLFAASAALHLTYGSQETLKMLRRLDHAAIYVMIAGTYTPIAVHTLEDPHRLFVLLIMWGMALIGVVYKLVFRLNPGYGSLIYYIAMGWVGVLAAPEVFTALPGNATLLIVSGGVMFTIGAIIYGIERPNFHPHFGFHELWHVFVLAGAGLHFVAIALFIA